ncbi:hypothetical protein jhhlp_004776 [Lomentospora prolificans]|uniref:Trichothecene 3-O-acetyltransferase-like N-terminal domain-containing protein n=1 Tax=Lomentospora prolificans TaxID=41688 RepID=A0A2N3N8E9_9PEZI|nr:hypothetical protein jhhlp_004776 [Lomentospora prolificans]
MTGSTAATTGNVTGHLDVFGQQPFLSKLYTQITSCYALPEDISVPRITETLTNGLRKLSASFPWIAGQVIHEPDENGTGSYRFAPLGDIPQLTVKDLRDDRDAMTMAQLREAGFPMSLLGETIVASRNTLTLPGSPDADKPAPVLFVQATLIKGGFLLTFTAQHNVVDMGGQGQIMRNLAKACHGEDFTAEEIANGNCDRRHAIPLLDDSYRPGPELEIQRMKPVDPQQPMPSPAKSVWAYFSFSPEALASLKSTAAESVTNPPGFLSTDDCVTAIIWQGTSRARLPRVGGTTKSTLARAIDVRRFLNIPNYPGVVQNMTYHFLTVQELAESPVGKIASDLRLQLDPKTSDIAFRTRALATMLERSADKTILGVTAMINPSTDVMLSSWANQDFFFDLDFNLGLGLPEAVRRPRFAPFESLMYLMPRKRGGDIIAGISLREEDMERLKKDEEFGKYAKYIG